MERIVSRYLCISSPFHKYSQTKKKKIHMQRDKVQNFRRTNTFIADISVHVTGHDIIWHSWNSFVTF